MELGDAVRARRSVRSFEDRPVPDDAIDRAIELAVQAPAPHHSSPWRFVIVSDPGQRDAFARAMGSAWRVDLASDGMEEEQIEHIVSKSHRLLTGTPVLVVCCADTSRAHSYPDERRRRAEWSLFAHTVGAALQVFMTSLAADGIASCWISAPVFCGEVVKDFFSLDRVVEPHALVLVGYPDASYRARPRPSPNASDYVIRP